MLDVATMLSPARAPSGRPVLASWTNGNAKPSPSGDQPGALGRGHDGIFYTRAREISLVLAARVELGASRQELLPLLRKLIALQKDGRYRSTQEDAFAVLAISKMAQRFAVEPGKSEVTLISGALESTHEIAGERVVIPLPVGDASVSLRASDHGALYVSWRRRGVPRDAGLYSNEDQGLEVRRRFFGLDGNLHDPHTFRQGESIVVELALATPVGRKNVVIVDALAAGFEIENPELVGSHRTILADERLGFERSDMRDDRLVLFVNPEPGRSTYRYVVRAVTPGLYSLPPVKAECMYDTAVRSVHGMGRVEVKK